MERLILALALLVCGTAAAAQPRIPGLDRRLAPGVRVAVKLEPSGSAGLVADEIEVREEDDDDVELRGVLDGVDVPGRRLRLLEFDVRGSAGTVLTREPEALATWGDLRQGLRVRIDGHLQPDGTVLAEKVRIRADQSYRERRLVGPIGSLEARGAREVEMRVLGRSIRILDSTELVSEGGRTRAALRRPRAGSDDDDLHFDVGARRLGPVVLAGEIRVRAESFTNATLAPSDPDRRLVPELFGIFGAAADLGGAVAHLEVEADREYVITDDLAADAAEERFRGDVRVSQAWVTVPVRALPWLSVTVGRQHFDDAREWRYSTKHLDGVRLRGELGAWALEASVSRDLFDNSVNVPDQQRTNLFAAARWAPTGGLDLEAWLLRRRLSEPGAQGSAPRMLGLRAMGELGRHLAFWADTALDRGERVRQDGTTDRLVRRDVEADALDIGATWRPRVPWDPTLTVAYAAGSGDAIDDAFTDAPADLPDRTFRQSGLERNRDRWNGTVSFRYYGEVLDPELTNLHIATLGLGIRPVRALSADLIVHEYRQDVALDELRGTDLEEDPLGTSTDLGREWDLVIGYEPDRRLEVRLVAGRFDPGSAFAPDAGHATVARFQAKLRF